MLHLHHQSNQRIAAGGSLGRGRKEEADQGVIFLPDHFKDPIHNKASKTTGSPQWRTGREGCGVSGWDGRVFRWPQCHGKHYESRWVVPPQVKQSIQHVIRFTHSICQEKQKQFISFLERPHVQGYPLCWLTAKFTLLICESARVHYTYLWTIS